MPIIFRFTIHFSFILAVVVLNSTLYAQQHTYILDPELHHIRNSENREWATFSETAESQQLTIHFEGSTNMSGYTLRLRQKNVKQPWSIALNDSVIARLHLNENDITAYFGIPAGSIRDGRNKLSVYQENEIADDIEVGQIQIIPKPIKEVLRTGKLTVNVTDRDSKEPLPSRITITNPDHSLQTVGARSNSTMAVRSGVIYTGNGTASFGLPAGKYTIYAGRGMEYGIDSLSVSISESEETIHKTLSIQKQVDTDGYVSSDIHTHTYTYSGHGDATIEERMLTIAGEGIELPVATDHNTHINYGPAAQKMNVQNYFSPIIGNEVTTPLGHFNIFPVEPETSPPDHQIDRWDTLFKNLFETSGIKVVILNHGRDIHGNFTPLAPENFNSVTGEFRRGFNAGFNAMEVINSGAQQTEMMQLFWDWFAMLNRGYQITPVAGSDSHDVSRFILGQARTYTRMAENSPPDMDIKKVADRMVNGEVNVSMGLFTEVTVDEKYFPGTLVPTRDSINVSVKVQGPDWVTAEVVELYRNGKKIRAETIQKGDAAGIKWEGKWILENRGYDSYLVAIAKGPGIEKPIWPIARPYQPDSQVWNPQVIAATGAVWLDEDGNEMKNPAFNYALSLVESYGDSLANLLVQLSKYDQATSVQAADIFLKKNSNSLPQAEKMKELLESSAEHVRESFEAYLESLEQVN